MDLRKKLLNVFEKKFHHPHTHLLNKDFQSAENFIREKFGEFSSDHPYACFLVIGPEDAGKTTLLQQAGLEALNSPHTTNERFCRWWFSPECAALDLKGNAFSDNRPEQTLLPDFFNQAKSFFQKHPLTHVMLVFSLPDLSTCLTDQKNYFSSLLEFLKSLSKNLKQELILNITLTQCDRIAGFSEFFSDLSQEERENNWGFYFDGNQTEKQQHDFKQEFDNFLRRLHQRLLWLLHHEPNLEKKFLIREFPVQLEAYRKELETLVEYFEDEKDNKLLLNSLHFCSSTQKGEEKNKLAETLQALKPSIEHQSDFPSTLFARPYFIHHLIANLNEASSKNATVITQTRTQTPPLGYALLLLPPLLAGIFWVKNHHLQQSQASLANERYQSFQQLIHHGNLSPRDLLSALNQLQLSLQYLTNYQPSLSMKSRAQEKASLLQKENLAYKQALREQLLPQINLLLEKKLASLDKTHPEKTYQLLKDYLMINQPRYLDLNYLHQSLFNENTSLFDLNYEETKNYFLHLTQAIDTSSPALSTNETIVQHARQLLDKVPYPLLAYALVKANTNESPLPFFQDAQVQKAFEFKSLPTLNQHFTAKQFATILKTQIPAMSQEVAEGSWVLGDKKQTALNKEELIELNQEVSEFYIGEYLETWKNFLTQTQVRPIQDFQTSAAILNGLSGSNGAFKQVLQLVAENTSLASLSQALSNANQSKLLSEALSQESFEQFNRAYLDKAQLNATELALQQLTQAISQIATHPDKPELILELTQSYAQDPEQNPITRLAQLAPHYPEPLRSTLENVAFANWKLLLDSSNQQIEQAWKTQILPFYQAKLAQRYPILKQAEADVALDDFKQFFSPSGSLAQFFNIYLKPFILADKAPWELRKVLNQSIAVSSDTLLQLERASLLSQMFFASGKDFGAHFSLQPLSMSPGLKQVSLHADGKQIIDYPYQGNLSKWTWPGLNTQSEVAIEFSSNEGQGSSLVKQGPWAWIKLLEQSHIQATNEANKFELTFEANGNAAKYLLETENVMNPFIPGVLEQFSFPNHL